MSTPIKTSTLFLQPLTLHITKVPSAQARLNKHIISVSFISNKPVTNLNARLRDVLFSSTNYCINSFKG